MEPLLEALELNPHVRLRKFYFYEDSYYVDVSIAMRLFDKCNKFMVPFCSHRTLSWFPSPSPIRHLSCRAYINNQQDIADQIKNMPNLLTLSFDEVVPMGIRRLCDSVRDHPTLTGLKVEFLHGDMTEMLLCAREYESVSFSCDTITPNIIKSLRNNRALTSLSICYSGKQTSELTSLLWALSSSSLRKLKIKSYITSGSYWEPLSLLEKRGLEKLDIDLDNSVETESCYSLHFDFDLKNFSFNVIWDKWQGESTCSKFFLSLTNLRSLTTCSRHLDEILEKMIRVNRSLKKIVIHGLKKTKDYLPALKENFTVTSFLCSQEDWKDMKQVGNIMARNRLNKWNHEMHRFYPERIRGPIELLISFRYLPCNSLYCLLPTELIFYIFSYLAF